MTTTRTDTHITDYLKMRDDFAVQMSCAAPKGWAARTYEGLVLAEGQPFERKPLPVTFRKMKEGRCFNNAFHCVLRDGHDQYRYVEGYAAGIIVTEHAWILDTDDGKIFDPTWPNDERHSQYFGIVFPTEFTVARTLDTQVYGLLVNDWMFENHLLRNGRSVWEEG